MNRIKTIHPFPARMAPEIALNECERLVPGSKVLDPMCGSGITLRSAIEHGHQAIGSDLDPLAVLMSRVFVTPMDENTLLAACNSVVKQAMSLNPNKIYLPWIDDDKETSNFIDFWFDTPQIDALRRLVYSIELETNEDIRNILKIALSRLIVTKEQKASLARDTSHSRPHRVALSNSYDVITHFPKSLQEVAKRLPQQRVKKPLIRLADARKLIHIRRSSIDAVITSPPYLNAIDYMRGNKMSLVWLGHSLGSLREVRSTSIGSERKPDISKKQSELLELTSQMDFYDQLAKREQAIFDRYILDIAALMGEISRVLKPTGRAVLVVGNSCLKGVFIRNTEAVKAAAKLVGLKFEGEKERDLPANRRYMALPSLGTASSMSKRMRTESVLTFLKT